MARITGSALAVLDAVTVSVTPVAAEFAAIVDGENDEVAPLGRPLTASVIAAAVFVLPLGATDKV